MHLLVLKMTKRFSWYKNLKVQINFNLQNWISSLFHMRFWHLFHRISEVKIIFMYIIWALEICSIILSDSFQLVLVRKQIWIRWFDYNRKMHISASKHSWFELFVDRIWYTVIKGGGSHDIFNLCKMDCFYTFNWNWKVCFLF